MNSGKPVEIFSFEEGLLKLYDQTLLSGSGELDEAMDLADEASLDPAQDNEYALLVMRLYLCTWRQLDWRPVRAPCGCRST